MKPLRALQEEANLSAQAGELFLRAVFEGEPHVHGIPSREDACLDLKPVGQHVAVFKDAAFFPCPVAPLQLDSLLVPDRGYVRVGQKGKAEVGPEGLRKVYDHIPGVFPGEENAGFGLAPWVHRAFQEAESRMAAPGVRENEQTAVPGPRRGPRLRPASELALL